MTKRPSRRPRTRRPDRRALSNVGGPVEAEGETRACAQLTTALATDPDEDAARAHVHGFHAYPARLHPTVARRLIELLAPAKGAVLDPFCGSGTVLVEAMLAGRTGWGCDINPLAVILARVKTRTIDRETARDVQHFARRVCQHATTRRTGRMGSTRRYPEADIQLFDPHVLLELDGLRDGIERTPPGFAREVLELVLSSLLVKVSRKHGDTARVQDVPRRLAAGFTTTLFERKTEELLLRLAAFRERVPRGTPAAEVVEADARVLQGAPAGRFDLVVTSPPYAGTYDYLWQHEARMRWLGLAAEQMERSEIGARRHLDPKGHMPAVHAFGADLVRVFHALHRVLRPDGKAVLVIADSVVAGKAVWADPLVRASAKAAGLAWVATASQRRPHFHGPTRAAFAARPKREHAILVRRETDAADRERPREEQS